MTTTSLNPFRNPQLISQSTGSSSRSAAGNESSGTTTINNNTAPERSSSSNDIMDVISEDAPPAYTPMADSFEGEAAMAFGPRRPFQPAPSPPPVHVSTPAATISHTAQPSVVVNMASQPIHSSSRFDFPPPPRHPSTATSAMNPNLNAPLPPTASVPPRPSTTSPSHTRMQSQSTPYLPPSGPPPHVRAQSFVDPPGHPPSQSFNPPPGPPPPQSFNSPPGPPPTEVFSPPPGPPPTRHPSNPVGRTSAPASGVGTSTMPDDGRPTTTPVPGHPLLRNGKLLVYPPGHECGKCHNTGYKSNDPSHPCAKCWERYARTYAGALAYAPFPSPSSPNHPASGSGSNFQQPLPVFRTPQSSFQLPHPQMMPGHQPKLHRKHSGHHGRRRSHSPPKHHHHRPHSPPHSHHSHSPPHSHHSHSPPHSHHSHSPSHSHFPAAAHMHHPPLHAAHAAGPHPQRPVIYAPPGQVIPPGPLVYPPGDSRIGGRLCWRCSGRGGVSYLFLGWETCAVCSGVGRVFT